MKPNFRTLIAFDPQGSVDAQARLAAKKCVNKKLVAFAGFLCASVIGTIPGLVLLACVYKRYQEHRKEATRQFIPLVDLDVATCAPQFEYDAKIRRARDSSDFALANDPLPPRHFPEFLSPAHQRVPVDDRTHGIISVSFGSDLTTNPTRKVHEGHLLTQSIVASVRGQTRDHWVASRDARLAPNNPNGPFFSRTLADEDYKTMIGMAPTVTHGTMNDDFSLCLIDIGRQMIAQGKEHKDFYVSLKGRGELANAALHIRVARNPVTSATLDSYDHLQNAGLRLVGRPVTNTRTLGDAPTVEEHQLLDKFAIEVFDPKKPYNHTTFSVNRLGDFEKLNGIEGHLFSHVDTHPGISPSLRFKGVDFLEVPEGVGRRRAHEYSLPTFEHRKVKKDGNYGVDVITRSRVELLRRAGAQFHSPTIVDPQADDHRLAGATVTVAT